MDKQVAVGQSRDTVELPGWDVTDWPSADACICPGTARVVADRSGRPRFATTRGFIATSRAMQARVQYDCNR